MDQIYQESALTIIAACGKGRQHGLPGVSRRRHAYYESETSSLYMRRILARERLIIHSF